MVAQAEVRASDGRPLEVVPGLPTIARDAYGWRRAPAGAALERGSRELSDHVERVRHAMARASASRSPRRPATRVRARRGLGELEPA